MGQQRNKIWINIADNGHSMITELWYDKYRPKTLDEYVWKDESVRLKIQKWINNPGGQPNLIIAGPYGVGKTTLALLLRNEFGLENSDFLFVDASIDTKIDDIRENVISFCENTGWSGIKLVVLDEAENLSQKAQESLKGTINRYGAYTRFIFTTNNLSRISGGMKSRARSIVIDALDSEAFMEKLFKIGVAEGIIPEDFSDDDMNVMVAIQDRSYPDLRKAIDLLQDSVSEDGTLVLSRSSTETSRPWGEFIVDTIMGETGVAAIRDFTASMSKVEIEDVYRFLYTDTTELFDDEGEAVRLIASYLDKNSRSAFPDITLTALLDELSGMRKNV